MPEEQRYEIAVIGCGPAGLSAAICAKLRNKRTILLGSAYCTRKLDQAPLVDNYLGIPAVRGSDLRALFLEHAKKAGLSALDARINAVYPGDAGFLLASSERTFSAQTVILAMGVSRTATLPGEEEYIGRGVSYCATCDGPLYKEKTVAVVSGIKEGEEEATYLAELCSKVYYLPQYTDVGSMPTNIEVVHGRPDGIQGDTQVRRLLVDKATLEVDGIFMIYDAAPAERIVSGLEMEEGHVKVDRLMRTSTPGLFAAGDCTGKPYQIAKAVGEGQVAALSAAGFLMKSQQIDAANNAVPDAVISR